MGRELRGRTLGLVGMSAVGSSTAALAATEIKQLLTTGQRPERLVNPAVWPRACARLAALGCGLED